jgi:hypothetical protein
VSAAKLAYRFTQEADASEQVSSCLGWLPNATNGRGLRDLAYTTSVGGNGEIDSDFDLALDRLPGMIIRLEMPLLDRFDRGFRKNVRST